jgi:hypothetical protein
MSFATKQLAVELAGYSDGILKYQYSDKGAQRITLANPEYTLKDKQNAINKILEKLVVLEKILPGDVGACSGKFETYKVQYSNNVFNIVFSGGKNTGIKLEKTVARELHERSGRNYEELKTKLNLTENYFVEHHKVSRHREGSLFVPTNIGAIISDITIYQQNIEEPTHISLKDFRGTTISNIGYRGLLSRNAAGGVIENQFFNDAEFLLTSVGVNKTLVASGIESWRVKDQKNTKEFIDVGFPSVFATMFLHTQIGYGYVLCKKKKDGSFFVKNFQTLKDTINFVGEVVSIKIGYPFYKDELHKRKQISLWMTTSTGIIFMVEYRDTDGGILPTQINTRFASTKMKE